MCRVRWTTTARIVFKHGEGSVFGDDAGDVAGVDDLVALEERAAAGGGAHAAVLVALDEVPLDDATSVVAGGGDADGVGTKDVVRNDDGICRCDSIIRIRIRVVVVVGGGGRCSRGRSRIICGIVIIVIIAVCVIRNNDG